MERIAAGGRSPILELETQGAKEVQATAPDAVTIFVQAPSFGELEPAARAGHRERGEIGERLALAKRQAEEADDFDSVVTNDDVERAVTELGEIIDAALTGNPSPAGKLSAP